MCKTKIKVGIIDDDETKRTQIMSLLRDGIEGKSAEVVDKYSSFELVPEELDIQPDVDDIIDEIIERDIDVLLVDYQLSSYNSNVSFTGVRIAEEIESKYLDFPTFVLTSFEDELYKQELFDPCKVFDVDRYMHDDNERSELNKKLIEQYLKRGKKIENAKAELNKLLKDEGTSQKIDNRILELDEFLERSLDGEKFITKEQKKRISDDRFDEMISLLRKIVEEE